MHGGISVTPLMTFPCQWGYTGLFLETLRSSWDLCWLLQGGIHNSKGKPQWPCLLLTFLTRWLQWRWQPLPLPAAPNVLIGRWLWGLSLIGEWNGQMILLAHTKVQEWMGYYRLCCNRDEGFLSLNWSRSFMPAWGLATFQPYGAR